MKHFCPSFSSSAVAQKLCLEEKQTVKAENFIACSKAGDDFILEKSTKFILKGYVENKKEHFVVG